MRTEPKQEPLELWIDLARVGFEEDLDRLMTRAGVNRSELAEAAGVSPAFVSKVLNGSTNYTLKTMAKLARAVGAVLQVRLIDENREVVRVVSPETASWLDDRDLTTVQVHDDEVSAEIVDLASRRAASRYSVRDVSDTTTGEVRFGGGVSG